MAQAHLIVHSRPPAWVSDYVDLGLRLGFDKPEMIKFITEHWMIRVGDGEWTTLAGAVKK